MLGSPLTISICSGHASTFFLEWEGPYTPQVDGLQLFIVHVHAHHNLGVQALQILWLLTSRQQTDYELQLTAPGSLLVVPVPLLYTY